MKKHIALFAFVFAAFSFLNAQGNIKAAFFNGPNFEEYVGTKTVSNIDFYWNREPPIKGVNPNFCSARYTGQLKTPRSGLVTFSARVDDGILVWINDILIINNWQLNDVGISEGTFNMEANVKYNIEIEYFNALREAELRLLWTLPEDPDQSWLSSWWPSDDPEIIPSKYFSAPIEKEVIAEVEPEPTPVLVPKSGKKPKPKPKVKPIVTTPKETPRVITPSKPTIDTLQKYIPKNVAFDRAKSEILSVSFEELNGLANFLKKNSTRKVIIEGHTDYVGDAAGNLLLSERRAKAIAAYLVKKGVQTQQIISAKGYGGSRPLVKSDAKYHPENRRVEFEIVQDN